MAKIDKWLLFVLRAVSRANIMAARCGYAAQGNNQNNNVDQFFHAEMF